jgi:hypothetical protein
MISTVVEQFDAVAIKNASIQKKLPDGSKQLGTKFAAIGSIEGTTTLIELIKMEEGMEVKKRVKPQKMDLVFSAHVPVQVVRDVFGFSNEDLKPGVYAYGKDSKGAEFTLTADVIDEFEDVTKLIAFPECTTATGYQFSIENGASEVAELSITLTAYADGQGKIMYDAIVPELDDVTIMEKWHQEFNPILVVKPPNAPTNLASSDITDTTLTLTWDSVVYNFGVASYEVFRDGVSVGTTTTSSFTDSGLTASTAYVYTVKAIGSNGVESPLSTELSVSTIAAV